MKQLIRDTLAPQVEEAIRDSAILDDYTYEVTLDLVPTQQGPQPIVFVLVAVPNPSAIGSMLTAMTGIPGPIPDDVVLSTAVLSLVNSLVDQRSEALKDGKKGLLLP